MGHRLLTKGLNFHSLDLQRCLVLSSKKVLVIHYICVTDLKCGLNRNKLKSFLLQVFSFITDTKQMVISHKNVDCKLHLQMLLDEVVPSPVSTISEPSGKSLSSSTVMSFIMLKFTAFAVSLMSEDHAIKDQNQ